jgi:hypothetical protein
MSLSGQFHNDNTKDIGGGIGLVGHIGYVAVHLAPAEHNHQGLKVFGLGK